MDHGDHSGHSGHTMPGMERPMPSCAMNMLWNNQVADTCVVFRSWHISGTWTMVLSCLIIIAISLFYSYLLHYIKQYDRQVAYNVYSSQQSGSASRRDSNAGASSSGAGLIPPIPVGYGGAETGAVGKIGVTKLPLKIKITRAGLYATSVAISFWLMLVAMTYNTYLFSSIVIGAFLGHIVYEGDLDVGAVLGGTGTKGLACH
ncbi:hypothetical protein L202_05929 [Cryptococcus amylolentus CBS 6039]|uniref:Copper transport protein n=2 Tax=Cryptococcus amylolentus TaxID=104669 RepID=A0A1E3HHY1_9TREE|nr:hypothetical protein L202_05929 [Cryptococcus amylolentus CBS 6039]ODN75948.1 hypothetical protein L202_05929 [Cryptococcus amylolentus CBS 6039]